MLKTTAILILAATNVMAASVCHAQVANGPTVQVPTPAPPETPAPGSDPSFVWVDKDSGTYLCPKDDWYGKTKNGVYMSEWNAKAQGHHAKDNKECNV